MIQLVRCPHCNGELTSVVTVHVTVESTKLEAVPVTPQHRRHERMPRCLSIYLCPPLQCMFREGHEDLHINGGISWDDTNPNARRLGRYQP